LMCAVDKDWITELTLIHKNIRSVRNSHISQSDVMSSPFTLKIFLGEIKGKMYKTHYMKLPLKTIPSVRKVSTYIITSIKALPVGLAALLTIMSVSTVTITVILYFYL
jgi:hypothetical protein